MRKFFRRAIGGVAVFACFIGIALPSNGQMKYGDVALKLVNLLEAEHYNRAPFDDKMSSRVLDAYLEILDSQRTFFTEEDIATFSAKHRATIGEQIKNRAIVVPFEIFAVFRERVQARVDYIREIQLDDYTFDSDGFIWRDRKQVPWPANLDELKQIWRGEFEALRLNEVLPDSPARENIPPFRRELAGEMKISKALILKRYEDSLSDLIARDTEAVALDFLKAIPKAFDPYSRYFSVKEYEAYQASLKKKFTGIGAMLRLNEDGDAIVEGLVVGGAAHKQGQLALQDQIIGLGPSEEGIVDVRGRKLAAIVDMIRGPVGTSVFLRVHPAHALGALETRLISIVRQSVDLKDTRASADLIVTKNLAGVDQKFGWIRLASFYEDATMDVRRCLTRLRVEAINGLIMDLRENEGGNVDEVIKMTGLFIKKGAVCQLRNRNGEISLKLSQKDAPVYDGPMIVLTNHSGGTGSEIFAAALQDYRRALIIGEKSANGSGTVQVMSGLGGEGDGQLHFTNQAFFRVNGESTQLKGVIPDLHWPSLRDVTDRDEGSLRNVAQVEPIPPTTYKILRPDWLPTPKWVREIMSLAPGTRFRWALHRITVEG